MKTKLNILARYGVESFIIFEMGRPKSFLEETPFIYRVSRQDQGHSEMPLHERKEKYQLMTLSDFHTIHIDMIIISVQLERIISY